MFNLPKELDVIRSLSLAFSQGTRQRFVVLTLGAIVAMGRRTVSRVLWAVSPLVDRHPSNYHRFFSAAHWSLWVVARVLASLVMELADPHQPVALLVDDTVTTHRGKRVYGKGWHRDAVNSTSNHMVKTLGHKWVVMSVNVMLPGCQRPWALPVLAALYQTPPKREGGADGQRRRQAGRANASMRRGGASKTLSRSKLPVLRKCNNAGVLEKRDKSPCLLARQMLAVMIHWFPDRRFMLLGDGGFASHDLAWFCHRHRRHVTLIARFCPDASLYALPSSKAPRKPGPRRTKGRRLPSPEATVAAAAMLRETTLPWYSQSRRRVQLLSAAAVWYRCRGSLRGAVVPIRWVFVRELVKDDTAYFYTTDPTLSGEQIATWFASRWSIEVTFQEVRAHLGFATPRQRCRNSVLRTAPCLLGLFSLVSLVYAQLTKAKRSKLQSTGCYAKAAPTFADALAAVRRVIWEQILLPRCHGAGVVAHLPPSLRNLLLDHLTAAA